MGSVSQSGADGPGCLPGLVQTFPSRCDDGADCLDSPGLTAHQMDIALLIDLGDGSPTGCAGAIELGRRVRHEQTAQVGCDVLRPLARWLPHGLREPAD